MGSLSRLCSGSIAMLFLLLPLTAVIPVSAGVSGDVEASPATLGLVPGEPVRGGSVEVRLLLANTDSFPANDVQYRFYKDSISSGTKFFESTVDIAGNSTKIVTATWFSLEEGERKVWVEFEHAGDTTFSFYKSFTVSGLANLEIIDSSISPTTGNRVGDTISVAVNIQNTGTVDAAESVLYLGVESQPSLDQYLTIEALAVGQTTWVNNSLIAPVGGEYEVILLPDVNGSINEIAESGKEVKVPLSIDPEPDYLHSSDPVVETPANSIRGDWKVSGTILRKHFSGESNVTVGFRFPGHTGSPIVIQPIVVSMNGTSDEVSVDWSTNLSWGQIQNLGGGQHQLSVQIDPFEVLEQATTNNDAASVIVEIRPTPNVVLDEFARPSSTKVEAGDPVTWRVSITNTGDIPVSGLLRIEWEGGSSDQVIGEIDAGVSFIWAIVLATSYSGAHTANFTATWIADSNSFDANLDDSVATGSVEATTTLHLQFVVTTEDIVSSTGIRASPPLNPGTYTYSIELTSSGLGVSTLFCEDITQGVVRLLSTTEVNIAIRGEKVSVECTFDTNDRSIILLNIRSEEDGTISKAHQKAFAVDLAQGIEEEVSESIFGSMMLFGFAAFALIGVLIIAVILTRSREEEVDRGIFEYCPACDGELEGDEDKCPYCDFNLKRARKRFHDCTTCGESMPSLLENCPYCGAVHDLRTQFKEREQKKQTIALPDEDAEEVAEDEDAIVTGTENFDETAKEFGIEEGVLESEWDEKLEAAEAQMEGVLERQAAELTLLEEAEEADDESAGPVVAIPNIITPEEAMSGHDIDAFLSDKKGRRHMVDGGDEGGDLDASDASIRGEIFKLTGEDGVLPGQEVLVGMGIQDHRLAGNELPEEAMDFSFEDDDLEPAVERQKRAIRRKKKEAEEVAEDPNVGECGSCGADLPIDADECATCGAKFA
ncbi:MAG: CARDB domain-containing protein [Candidatus Poseidoniales archaeon]